MQEYQKATWSGFLFYEYFFRMSLYLPGRDLLPIGSIYVEPHSQGNNDENLNSTRS